MRPAIKQALFLMLLAAIAALGAWALSPAHRMTTKPVVLKEGEVQMETATRWTLPPIWIDARSRSAFEKNHIPGAFFLSVDETENFEQLLFEIDKANVFDGSRSAVVYCDSASCKLSHEVAQRLRERYPGLKVFTLFGGWQG